MEQQVEYMRIAFQTRQKYLADRYQFRADKKWHWAQKLAIWTLRKIGCQASFMEETMVRSETINLRNLEKQILEQQNDTIDWYHHAGECLLIGPKEFGELMMLPLDHPLSLNLNYTWGERDKAPPWNTHYTRHHLKVVVIPHMKGVLVLPKGWNE